ncbi:MAG: hypothetical protein HWE09_15485, partial [Cyclobacteriaceae bacterium]|nr:hypothetical protein [Cyclobacteriaceae bacterium]
MKFQFQPKKIYQDSLIVVPIFKNLKEELLKEKFPDLSIPDSLFSAKKDSEYVFPFDGKLVLVLGLGTEPSYKEVETAFRRILAKKGDMVKNHVILDFPDSFGPSLVEA